MQVEEHDSNLIRASKEVIFVSGIDNIQYKQKYYQTGSVLDCTYKLETIP
nr:hypothetical protein HAGR004_41480 [Bdellovibrio sp. HAGR004]